MPGTVAVVPAGTRTSNRGRPSAPLATDVTVWSIVSRLTTVTVPPPDTVTAGVEKPLRALPSSITTVALRTGSANATARGASDVPPTSYATKAEVASATAAAPIQIRPGPRRHSCPHIRTSVPLHAPESTPLSAVVWTSAD